ncbi:MAG TPA: D-aminoacyl-tRNA deacylase [Chitinophagaceae bacterium]|nr:MAG: D-tyrosyl-tRNA(Tyr) deacylase [Bacteroidetes bacterium OLB11]HMN33542.1 D-aminoacyl-tRNA deacylase [Chitinophagaceae bacterium]
MKAVIQRVKHASVEVDHQIVAQIKQGVLVLLGIEEKDDIEDIEWLSSKIIAMRIFNDEQGLMNLGLKDVKGDILLVSQFTLHASTKKGNRPSFIQAAKPVIAIPLYEKMIEKLEEKIEKKIFKGIFGADMSVELCNDGPVTIIIDSKNKV